MWRRFSSSSTESTSPSNQQQPPPPPPPPSTPVSAPPKSATSLAQHQPQLTKPQTNPSTKEHELANQRPAGAGQRRRSSLLEKWTRESTKEEQNMIHYIP